VKKIANQALSSTLAVLALSWLSSCSADATLDGAGKTSPRLPGGSSTQITGTGEGTADVGDGPAITSSFVTPSASGVSPVVDALAAARRSVRMMMYHLTVQPVLDALSAAAHRGVDVQIIIDGKEWSSHTPAVIKNQLSSAGVRVVPSSTGFSITHVKAMVIDEATAIVMSLNLTSHFDDTRDYAVITTDAGVIREFLGVFEADVANAASNTANTPALSSPALGWSPVNAEERVLALIDGAQSTLEVTTENLGAKNVSAALARAAARGVKVRLIAPLCDEGAEPLYDVQYLTALAGAGVSAHAMPAPSSAQQPYMHGKMAVADGKRAFVGSTNLSVNSLVHARELDIFFSDPTAIAGLEAAFTQDWAYTVAPADATSSSCPSSSPGASGSH
jgi:phosphatidylserine/phosphatidylglycerophosphate/cardiolipin synthase-like enzyme